MKKKWIEFGLWFVLLVFLALAFKTVPPEFSFANDSLIKLLQAKSLLANKFLSDNYYYFLKKYDPKYQFFPIDYHLYHLTIGDKHIGPFGILFSFLTAPILTILDFSLLPIFSGVLLLIMLIVLRTVWKVRPLGIFITAFCTSLIIYGVEYSENIIFIFLSFLSFTFFFKTKQSLFSLFFSGLLFGICVGLRLESVLFFPLFVFSYLVIVRKFTTRLYPIVFFSVSFVVVLCLFLGLNYFAYGHPLGTKFLADKGNFFLGLEHKLNNYLSLLFGKKEEAFFKVGFFGLTPIFLWVVYAVFRNWNAFFTEQKILFISCFLYILIAPAFAPHDGQWTWGARYLAIAVIPFSILLDRALEIESEGKVPKWKIVILVLLTVYSIVQVQLGLKIIGISANIMKLVQKNTAKIETDIRLFHSGIFALHTGPQILDKPSLLAVDKIKLKKLIPILKKRFPGKTIAYIYSEKLDMLLTSGGASIQANSQEFIEELSSEFEKQEKKPDLGPDIKIHIFKI